MQEPGQARELGEKWKNQAEPFSIHHIHQLHWPLLIWNWTSEWQGFPKQVPNIILQYNKRMKTVVHLNLTSQCCISKWPGWFNKPIFSPSKCTSTSPPAASFAEKLLELVWQSMQLPMIDNRGSKISAGWVRIALSFDIWAIGKLCTSDLVNSLALPGNKECSAASA